MFRRILRHVWRVLTFHRRELVLRRSRSSLWPALEKRYLTRNPGCAACGSLVRLRAHHIVPVKLAPEMELDPHNLVPLCMGVNECHFTLGHGGDWGSWNPDVRHHANLFMQSPSPSRRHMLRLSARLARRS